MGFGSIGRNVNVHKTAVFFCPQNIHLGNDVRIDCFSLLSAGVGGIYIGNNVHIAASVFIYGGGGKVTLESFAGLSARVTIYTSTDDFVEGNLTNPTIPEKYRKLTQGPVLIRKHALVGVNSVIMPGVELGMASSIGAMSFVKKSIKEFDIAAGCPVRIIGKRDKRILQLEKKYLAERRGAI